ncbi:MULTISPECIES: hypothetical protein [unclassified Sphingomonas]|uniref:hypothetical protein n=1 Tax=unclassified Sphingomonas TaxID=196159 RepID=UPI00215159D0|nr:MULTISPECIES: hypothetical protein [unclassified Sphingomonas]MCR5872574.1 hypothetical protein [Sphingomonas sp. J344]UUX99136.1 hypothetical protein LRS08_16900 [Sphingomonas sp. J315]
MRTTIATLLIVAGTATAVASQSSASSGKSVALKPVEKGSKTLVQTCPVVRGADRQTPRVRKCRSPRELAACKASNPTPKIACTLRKR